MNEVSSNEISFYFPDTYVQLEYEHEYLSMTQQQWWHTSHETVNRTVDAFETPTKNIPNSYIT